MRGLSMAPLHMAKLFWAGPDILPQLVSLAEQCVAEAMVVADVFETDGEAAMKIQRAKGIEHDADEIVHSNAKDSPSLQFPVRPRGPAKTRFIIGRRSRF
jgi:hypothetical protein